MRHQVGLDIKGSAVSPLQERFSKVRKHCCEHPGDCDCERCRGPSTQHVTCPIHCRSLALRRFPGLNRCHVGVARLGTGYNMDSSDPSHPVLSGLSASARRSPPRSRRYRIAYAASLSTSTPETSPSAFSLPAWMWRPSASVRRRVGMVCGRATRPSWCCPCSARVARCASSKSRSRSWSTGG